MKQYILRRSWKNDTLLDIAAAELDPRNFNWGEEKTGYSSETYVVSILRYVNTDFYFKFDRSKYGEFICRFYPGNRGLPETVSSYLPEWEDTRSHFQRWLFSLKQDVVDPDFWEQLKEYAPQETFIGTGEISNVPFSYSEVENIIGSLDKLQSQIEKNFNLQGEQLSFVKREIEYLKDAAKRQGRKDWMHTSIGVIMTIAVGLALSPEKTKLLWDLLKSCFAGLLQLPAP